MQLAAPRLQEDRGGQARPPGGSGDRGCPRTSAAAWIPYGYRRTDDGTIAVLPEEAAVVERFRWASEGRRLPSIAMALRDEKAPTRNGGAWRPFTIRGMPRNRFYTGRGEFLIRARHDAIVSDVLFNACQGTGKPA